MYFDANFIHHGAYSIDAPPYAPHPSKPQLHQRPPPAEPVPPSTSFYIHWWDAKRQLPPPRMCVYRPPFNATTVAQRQRKAGEQHSQQLQLKMAKLAERLDKVGKKVHENRERRTSEWLKLRDHCVFDMQVHVAKRESLLSARLQRLRGHNVRVKQRVDLLQYKRFLSSMKKTYEKAKQFYEKTYNA